jgi:glycosyltransferase involved in cell wall biosynthesis
VSTASSVIELSVVVCTYNRADWLGEALGSLARQTFDPDRYEVLLVDNNSTDATATVAAGFQDKIAHFCYLREERQGLSHARNLGWQSANGEFVAFMDDDARAASDWCERIVAAFRNVTPRPVSVGGKILPLFESPLPSWFTPEIEIRSWGESAGFLDGPRRRYGFSGSNMSFPLDVFARYGGFSTGLGMQGNTIRLGEDSHLFNRIQEQEPLFWYDPQLIVHHLVPKRNLRLRYRLIRAYAAGKSVAFMQLERGERNSLSRELFNAVYFVKELCRSLLRERGDRSVQFRKLCDLVKQIGVLNGR